jgi:hypothetical protein
VRKKAIPVPDASVKEAAGQSVDMISELPKSYQELYGRVKTEYSRKRVVPESEVTIKKGKLAKKEVVELSPSSAQSPKVIYAFLYFFYFSLSQPSFDYSVLSQSGIGTLPVSSSSLTVNASDNKKSKKGGPKPGGTLKPNKANPYF